MHSAPAQLFLTPQEQSRYYKTFMPIFDIMWLSALVPWQPLRMYRLHTSVGQRGMNIAQTDWLRLFYLFRSLFGSLQSSRDEVKLKQGGEWVRSERSAWWNSWDEELQLLSFRLSVYLQLRSRWQEDTWPFRCEFGGIASHRTHRYTKQPFSTC